MLYENSSIINQSHFGHLMFKVIHWFSLICLCLGLLGHNVEERSMHTELVSKSENCCMFTKKFKLMCQSSPKLGPKLTLLGQQVKYQYFSHWIILV